MFLKRYIEQFKQSIKAQGFTESTIRSYGHHIKPFMRYLAEKKIASISEINRQEILGYQLWLMTEKSAKSVQTRCNRLSVVKSLFKYLLKSNKIIYDPSSDLQLPRRKKSIPRGILSVKEIMKILQMPNSDTALGLRNKAILEVLYATGMRNSELRNLHLKDVDVDEGRIVIRSGKGQKDRVVPLGEIALGYLEEYIFYGRGGLLKEKEEGVLFLSKGGRRISTEDLIEIIKKYTRKARIKKKITPHCIRHTCATHLLKNGAGIRYIQELLGHESIESTEIYTRVDVSDLKKAHRKYHPRERKA